MTPAAHLTAAMWRTALTGEGHAELATLTDAYRVQEHRMPCIHCLNTGVRQFAESRNGRLSIVEEPCKCRPVALNEAPKDGAK